MMTSPGLSVRKQVYELSPQDLVDYPIWEFCSNEEGREGQNEATVRPTEKAELSGELPGACVVACDVIFADESAGVGYLYNCEDGNISCIQPNVFAGQSQVNFWLGWLRFVPNAPERVEKSYRSIDKDKEAIFPLSFRSRVDVNGKPLHVVLQGFMALGMDMKPVILG
jgi:hypothetical protein